MEAFLRSDQYNFIKSQAYILANGHASANDSGVIAALKSLAMEKVEAALGMMTDEQRQLIELLITVENREGAELFLLKLAPYIIPFQDISQQTLKKLFPKAKKLRLPDLEEMNMQETSYLSWIDKGTNRKYMITSHNNKLIGLHGTFQPIHKKGICALCNKHAEVGMFLYEKKGEVLGTFVKRGNYICQNSTLCNQHITELDKLHDFIERLRK